MKKYITIFIILLAIILVVIIIKNNSNESDPYPSSFDLRSLSIVTPVKNQAPWNTCWAHSFLAQAEIDMLSKKNVQGLNSTFDLSEKQLILSSSKMTEKYSEGIYYYDSAINSNFTNSGASSLAVNLYSSGVNPIFEESCEYSGNNKTTEYQWVSKNQNRAFCEIEEDLRKNHIPKTISEKYIIKCIIEVKKMVLKKYDHYSKHDDWNTLNDKELLCNQSSCYMKDANYLPDFSNRGYANLWDSINQYSTQCIKKQIYNKHGVTAVVYMENKKDIVLGKSVYMNPKTWSQYTYDDITPNHSVCIVGWDDNYDIENFNSIKPPGKGAWIVKNSYGSEMDYRTNEEGRPIGRLKWGVLNNKNKHTGYYYISYYDKSLKEPLSVEYDVNSEVCDNTVYQYDLIPCIGEEHIIELDKPIKIANIFRNTNKNDFTIESISIKTSKTNSMSKIEVYELDDNYHSPEDGKLLYSSAKEFDYKGYHRINVDKPITIPRGKTFSIVEIEINCNSDNDSTKYTCWFNCGLDENIAKTLGYSFYTVSVINRGESYIYQDDKWMDLKDYDYRSVFDSDGIVIDNFTIKAFGSVS